MDEPTDQNTIYLIFSRGEASNVMEDLPLGQSVSEDTRNLYRRLRQELRNPSQGDHHMPPDPGQPHLYAPPQLIRPMPERMPRRGLVVRKTDITGISGLGVIAEFCMFSDGAVAWRWLGGPPQDQPKWEFYDNKTTAPFEQISGHNGNTEIVWIDEEEPAMEVPLDQ